MKSPYTHYGVASSAEQVAPDEDAPAALDGLGGLRLEECLLRHRQSESPNRADARGHDLRSNSSSRRRIHPVRLFLELVDLQSNLPNLVIGIILVLLV